MQRFLKSLVNTKKMPLPFKPVVEAYGIEYAGVDHFVHLFPAVVRPSESVNAEAILEEGQASCFFHEESTATAICDVSGRMICDLCKTEWNGRTISIDALQSLMKEGKSSESVKSCTMWDTIALSLVLIPLLFSPLLVVTAPIALGICLLKWRAGPTGILRRSRWRYVVAALIALLEIGVVVMMIIGMSM